jgi:hypothetical protein
MFLRCCSTMIFMSQQHLNFYPQWLIRSLESFEKPTLHHGPGFPFTFGYFQNLQKKQPWTEGQPTQPMTTAVLPASSCSLHPNFVIPRNAGSPGIAHAQMTSRKIALRRTCYFLLLHGRNARTTGGGGGLRQKRDEQEWLEASESGGGSLSRD